jgi:SAM-dependent methyltransferase
MRIRLAAGRLLTRTGRFVQSLALMVMKPGDIVEYSRAAYAKPESVSGWAEPGLVDAGLSADESALLEKLPVRGGELLLLGVGGGREAVPLASAGFRVTGVDFVAELAARAEENLRARGLPIRVLVQDMSALDLPEGRYHAAWLTSGGCYSSVPTCRRRLEMLSRVRRALKPGGFFVCQFLVSDEPEFRRGAETLRRLAAWLTLGNLSYEPGDRLLAGLEFAHHFRDEREVRGEFEGAGFRVVEMLIPSNGAVGGAVLKARDA